MRGQTEEELTKRWSEAKDLAKQLKARLAERQREDQIKARKREFAKKRRRGEVLERLRKGDWEADASLKQAMLRRLDEELTDVFDREAFGLPPAPSSA